MKDIFEILKDNGIEVEEGKQKDIRRSLNENYIAINEHTKKIDALTDQVNTANGTVTDLKDKLEKANEVDVEALRNKIKEYEDAENTRKQNEAVAKKLEALESRFTPLKGENKFLNEGTENWIFDEFKKALDLDENKGKSDIDIYSAITKGKNIYESPNKVKIPPANGSNGTKSDEEMARAVMGLPEKK